MQQFSRLVLVCAFAHQLAAQTERTGQWSAMCLASPAHRTEALDKRHGDAQAWCPVLTCWEPFCTQRCHRHQRVSHGRTPIIMAALNGCLQGSSL